MWTRAAVGLLILGTASCAHRSAQTRGDYHRRSAALHGSVRGEAILDGREDATRVIVQIEGARPGRYAVFFAPAVACPYDAAGEPIDATTGTAGVATGAGTGAGGFTGENATLGAEQRETQAADRTELRDRSLVGELSVGSEGRGALQATLPRWQIDLENPRFLEENTILVRDAGASNVTEADLTTGLIACGRFSVAEDRAPRSPDMPRLPPSIPGG